MRYSRDSSSDGSALPIGYSCKRYQASICDKNRGQEEKKEADKNVASQYREGFRQEKKITLKDREIYRG